MSSTSQLREREGPIVVADPSRERRLFFEHAFRCLGYSSFSAAGGVEALRLVRDHEPPLLVAHTTVLCGSDPLTLSSRSDSLISGTRVLWFCEDSSPPRQGVDAYGPTTTFVLCGDNPGTVVSAAQALLTPGHLVSRHSHDFLLSLMLLDAELRDLPADILW